MLRGSGENPREETVEMVHGVSQRGPGDLGADAPVRDGRFRRAGYEFAKFAVIGTTGVFITNAVYDVLFVHLGAGPVTSTTIATVVAAIATYLGNRYWSFRTRQRTGVVREIAVFAVLNGIGLLIQDAAVGFSYYLLHLGHHELAGLIALNAGIALATLFRFWSYRRFVWVTPGEDSWQGKETRCATGISTTSTAST